MRLSRSSRFSSALVFFSRAASVACPENVSTAYVPEGTSLKKTFFEFGFGRFSNVYFDGIINDIVIESFDVSVTTGAVIAIFVLTVSVVTGAVIEMLWFAVLSPKIYPANSLNPALVGLEDSDDTTVSAIMCGAYLRTS